MSIFFDFLKSHQLYSFAAASLIISTFLKFGKKFSRKQMVNSSINLHFLFQLILILMKLRDRMMPEWPCSMPTTTFMINLQVLMVWPLLPHATIRFVTLKIFWAIFLLKKSEPATNFPGVIGSKNSLHFKS